MITIIIILEVIIGFFIFKAYGGEFEKEGMIKQSRWNSREGVYIINYEKRNYGGEWVARFTFWKMVALLFFWPIILPIKAFIYALQYIYDKLNINKFKIFKKDEEIRKTITSTRTSDSND